MTHFTVLVKAELESGNLADMKGIVEEMLQPYDEGIEVPRYKDYMDSRDIELMAKHYKVDMTQPVMTALAQLLPHLQDWNGSEGGIDIENDTPKMFHWSTYNPQSKWDWYQIGGRWQGTLRLHVGKMGLQGDLGVPNRDAEVVNFDIAFLKDVDFAGMSKRDKDSAVESYYKAVDRLLKAIKYGENIDQVISELYWTAGIEDESLEEYVARFGQFSTHAVLDANGWHEWGKSGYWGTVHSITEPEGSWSTKYAERYLSNPTDKTVIAIVDCHI